MRTRRRATRLLDALLDLRASHVSYSCCWHGMQAFRKLVSLHGMLVLMFVRMCVQACQSVFSQILHCNLESLQFCFTYPACLHNTSFSNTARAQMREVVYEFYGSRYAACLARLQRLLPLLRLDLHLAPHVVHLYQQARTTDELYAVLELRCRNIYVYIYISGRCAWTKVTLH